MARFELGQTAMITGVVAEHVPGTAEVVLWVRGCTVPCHITIGAADKVEVGDTIELTVEVVGVGKKALALKCQDETLTIHPPDAAW